MFRKNIKLKKFLLNRIFIWGVVALFTIFQLFLEMLTNTMTTSLMTEFRINYTEVGILSSAFFYSFLLMQFPAGIILDRYNLRWVLTIACAGCGVGCLLFGRSATFFWAVFSRFIMGGFAAFGFLGLLKISTIWYPAKLFPFLVGFSQFLVMIIIAFGEPAVFLYINHYGFRIVLNYAGYIAFGIAILISFSIYHPKKDINQLKHVSGIMSSLRAVLRNKQCWLASIFGFGMFSTIASFSALWGLTFLKKVYVVENSDAVFGISMNFAGVALGCALFGFLASYFKNHLILIRLSALSAFVLILGLIFPPKLTLTQLYIILFLLGLFSGCFLLCFDIVKNAVPNNSVSIATAFCNIFVMSSTLLLQPLMGFLIDLSHSHRFSMVVLICTIFISLFVSYFIREKSNSTKVYSLLVNPPYVN